MPRTRIGLERGVGEDRVFLRVDGQVEGQCGRKLMYGDFGVRVERGQKGSGEERGVWEGPWMQI